MSEFLASPIFIAVLWPIIFAILEVLSTVLTSDTTLAQGEHKYRISHMNPHGVIQHTAPVTIDEIIRRAGSETITDINRLIDRRLDIFSFGLELSIGTIATDLSLAAATRSPMAQTFIALVVFHLLIYVGVVYVLRVSQSRTVAVWSTNGAGVLSIISMFILVGGQVVR